MDAHAHLLSLGWAGPGHSLDSRPNSPGAYKQKGHRGLAYDPKNDPLKVGNTGNGLVKPLLVSHRKNRFGIGKKAHEAPAGNEWWLKGFESALGNIGKSESERSCGTSTPINAVPVKHGGLYSFFVKGQMMQGTIGQDLLERTSRKRKSDEFEEDSQVMLNPRPTSPKKPATAEEFEMVGAFMRERDKQRKNKIEMERVGDAEKFAQIGVFLGVVEKDRKKKRKSNLLTTNENVNNQINGSEERQGTKEERRERRRLRKEKKALTASVNGSEKRSDSDDPAAKAARKAQRRQRKAEKEARKNAL